MDNPVDICGGKEDSIGAGEIRINVVAEAEETRRTNEDRRINESRRGKKASRTESKGSRNFDEAGASEREGERVREREREGRKKKKERTRTGKAVSRLSDVEIDENEEKRNGNRAERTLGDEEEGEEGESKG